MNKRIISKVGKRHRPDIDMMEFMQIEEIREFDLDKEIFDDDPLALDDIDSLLLFGEDNDERLPEIKIKKPKGC